MKQTKLEKQIKEIAKRNFTIMGIPSRKGIKEILSLIETEREEAVKGFGKFLRADYRMDGRLMYLKQREGQYLTQTKGGKE